MKDTNHDPVFLNDGRVSGLDSSFLIVSVDGLSCRYTWSLGKIIPELSQYSVIYGSMYNVFFFCTFV